MHDIDEVAYETAYVYENIKKGQKKVERRDKILFFIKWFGLGLLVGTVIMALTSCGSAPAEDTRPLQTIEGTVTEEPAPAQSTETVPEPKAEKPTETAEPAQTEHAVVDATWHESTKLHDGLNVNSALKFEDRLIWNFSDCTAVGQSATDDVTTATEADYGFIIRVIDNDTVIVDPYDNSDTGIVSITVTAEVGSGDYTSTETLDTYEITGYSDCVNGLGLVKVTFSDNIILTAGVFKENDRLYAVNINKDTTKATRIINCRLAFESLMNKAGITEADAVYTDPIYYPIVPVNPGEVMDTAYCIK